MQNLILEIAYCADLLTFSVLFFILAGNFQVIFQNDFSLKFINFVVSGIAKSYFEYKLSILLIMA